LSLAVALEPLGKVAEVAQAVCWLDIAEYLLAHQSL
jgi:hypothetical protein